MTRTDSLLKAIELKNQEILLLKKKIEAHEFLLDGYTQYCVEHMGEEPKYSDLVKAAHKLRKGE